MYLELKQAIINWLIDNKNHWQRVNACYKEFRQYIYDDAGNYIIGGKVVSDFISDADKLLFKGV
jgi:hypothetical protein